MPDTYSHVCHTWFYCWMQSRGIVWTQLSHLQSQIRHIFWCGKWKKHKFWSYRTKIAKIGPWGYKKPCHTSFYCWMLSRGMVWTQLSHSQSQTRRDWWSRKWKNTNFEHVATKSHHHHYPLINMQHLICIKLSGYKRPASTQVLNIIRMVNFTRRIGFPLVCYILSYKYTVWKSTNYDN